MKRICYAPITGPDYNRQMGEIQEAEHSREWDGDVAAYLENLDEVPEYLEGAEHIPGDVKQNFGPMNPENICVIFHDAAHTEPWEIWWSEESNADDE